MKPSACRTLLLALALLAAGMPVRAGDASRGAPGARPGDQETARLPRTFAIRAGTVYTVSAGVLAGGVILVEDGKIAAVGRDVAVPAGTPLYDLSGHIVLPGLIDAETTLASDARDTRESVAPEVRALDGWDFFKERTDALRGGVTTVYIAPGIPARSESVRLVSGSGAVVKTGGSRSDPLRRVLRETAGVQVTLGELSRRQPSIYEPPVPPSPDNPFEVTRPPLPQSRAGEFLALRRVLERASAYRDAVEQAAAGAPAPLPDLTCAALYPLLAGEDHLRVRANKARDIYHILELAREEGLAAVIEGGAEAERLAPWLAAMQVPVVVPGAFEPGRLPGGDLASPAIEGRLDEGAILRMHRAGVRVIIHSPSDADVKNLLLQAAAAVRFGMDPEAALRAVTLEPAEVLGIADRAGSIAPGKDADLVVLGRDPFGGWTAPQAVLIEGELVYSQAPEIPAGATVVRCGRILTGSGQDHLGGIIVIEGSKLAYVGPGVLLGPLEKGTRVIDASGSTVVPGLIDAGGTAGTRAEALFPGFDAVSGSGGARSSARFRLADAIDPRDPSLEDLVRAGITTAIIVPPPGREVSGQVSALKLRARDPSSAVLEGYAALHFGGLSSRTLKSAREYYEAWKTFEGKREEAARKGAKFDEEPPKRQEELEPYRPLFAGKLPAVVDAASRSSLESALKLLRDEHGMRVIASGLGGLASPEDLESAAGLLREKCEGALLEMPFIVEERGNAVHRPRELASRGVPVGLMSRVATGARLLPLQVAYAVQHGWDPGDALRAMASVPARLFGIDGRVGSLAKGKDADLVVLSGEPFAITTRVLAVMVEGRIVHGLGEFEALEED